VSQEVLAVYLQHYPDSVIGTNVKACNHFRLYNGKAAEAELKALSQKTSHSCRFAEDLIKHNLVYIILFRSYFEQAKELYRYFLHC
jgi:intraflagellar transport protein 56